MRARSLLAGAALVAACTARRAEQAAADSALTAPVTPPRDTAAAAPDTTERWFSSVLGGFDLRIPVAWGQRFSASERSEPDEYPRAAAVVDVVFLAESGGVPPALVTVVRYPKAAWAAVSGPAGAAGTGVVAETATDVFVATVPTANPYPKGSPDAEAFGGMQLTLEQVKARFRAH